MSIITALRRLRRFGRCEFEASLGSTVSSRPAWDTVITTSINSKSRAAMKIAFGGNEPLQLFLCTKKSSQRERTKSYKTHVAFMLDTSYFHLTFSHGTRLLLLLLWVFRSTKKTFKGAISDVAQMGLGLASLTSELVSLLIVAWNQERR